MDPKDLIPMTTYKRTAKSAILRYTDTPGAAGMIVSWPLAIAPVDHEAACAEALALSRKRHGVA